MTRSKEAWLREGASDLKEAVVSDVPVKGQSVRVRGLPAGYSNDAQSKARELRIVGTDTISVIDARKLEVLQFVHGVIDPVFTEEEAEQIADNFGPAWRQVVDKIDELSAFDKEAVQEAANRFPASGADESGADVGHANGARSAGSDLPAPVGGAVGNAGS